MASQSTGIVRVAERRVAWLWAWRKPCRWVEFGGAWGKGGHRRNL